MRQWNEACLDLQTPHDALALIAATRAFIAYYGKSYFLDRQELRAFSTFLEALLASSEAKDTLKKTIESLTPLQYRVRNSSMGLMLRYCDLEKLDQALAQFEAVLAKKQKHPPIKS